MGRVTPLLTSRKVLDITYQTPQEALLGTPETLPTSEPTPQIGYTVASGDLPVFSFSPYKKIFTALLFGGGQFITAGTVSWRIKKNSLSVANGSTAIGVNSYFTVLPFFYDVSVGDLLELALWSNKTDSVWDYEAYQIQVTRVVPMNKPRLHIPVNFAVIDIQPVLALGTPTVLQLSNPYIYHDDSRLPVITSPTIYDTLFCEDTYGMYRLDWGDTSSANAAVVVSYTSRPRYRQNRVITQIILRGARID